MEQTYVPIIACWAGVKNLGAAKYWRGVQINITATHEFTVRRMALGMIHGAAFGRAFGVSGFDSTSRGLVRQFDIGFDSGFDTIVDQNIPKSNFFLFMEDDTTTRGRLFRIETVMDAEERKEYLLILAREIEEQGTGYPI